MHRLTAVFASCLLACSAAPRSDDEGAASQPLTTMPLETASAAVDCRIQCPGVAGASSLGPLPSGTRGGSVDFLQLPTCAGPFPVEEGTHTLRAGEPCYANASPMHGQPLWGATACEQFECGETGTFVASACLSTPRSRTDPLPWHRCATREEACAAALAVQAVHFPARPLCR